MFYTSATAASVEDDETSLYGQSPLYLSIFHDEMQISHAYLLFYIVVEFNPKVAYSNYSKFFRRHIVCPILKSHPPGKP
jgi:hypothetical protein